MAKISIKIASKGNNNFDLSSNHITTTDFGQIQVSNFLPVIPNDKIRCSLFSEARFAPMVVPTFMDVKLVTRSFYVPMSAIYQPFEYFYTDKQDSSVFKTMPSTTNAVFVTFFSNPSYGLTYKANEGMEFDFELSGGYRYIMTEKGRLFYKLLLSLGYSINWTSSDETSFSLLPLLAFARVCYDYVYPSQYLDGLGLTAFFKICSSSEYSALLGSNALQYAFFDKVSSLLTLPYKQDYFTASWKSLNAPGTSVQSITKYPSEGGSVVSTENTVNTEATGTNYNKISAYSLQLLQRMYDFVTRNNIVGTRYADQLFARFGIGSRKSDPDMSQFIGQHIQPINVIDVTAMSAGQGQELGELAGKAYLQGKGNLFTFDSIDEFGYILCLSFVMPEIGYYQGRKRWTTQFSRFDFVHPEFDMQMRAIRNDELFADFNNPTDYSSAALYGGVPQNRFSFAPTYSEFKKGDDYLTGDFRVKSLSRNLNSYHLMRDLPTPSSKNPLALNSGFLFCKQHQFDKIFAQMYTLRLPLTLRENISFNNVVCLENKPVVWARSEEAEYGFVLRVDDNGFISPDYEAFSYLPTLLDVPEITSDYCSITYMGTTTNKFHFFGEGFRLYNFDKHDYVTLSSLESRTDHYQLQTHDDGIALRIITYGDFLIFWQDYIDHIYLRHRFDIKASRSLQPISEEFMIDDGGAKVNVDMNGNRIV